MASSENLMLISPYGVLSKAQFKESGHGLTFRFEKADRIDAPDLISFEVRKDVAEKIIALAKKIPTLSWPNCHFLQARNCGVFFEAIRQLQDNGTKITINPKVLRAALCALREASYITPQEEQKLQSTIRTGLTLREFEEEVEQTWDAEKALALARYYLAQNQKWRHGDQYCCQTDALWWLCNANKFLHGQSIGSLLDLDAFFQNFTRIASSFAFFSHAQEITDALARCPFIKELYVSARSNYDNISQGVGRFLERSVSVESVDLTHTDFPYDCCRELTPLSITPIANALRTNTTIQRLFLSNAYNLGNEGVLKLIQAIEANPHSAIKTLYLRNCNMTDMSATALLELLKKREDITKVCTDHNEGISKQVQEEIDRICEERKKSL